MNCFTRNLTRALVTAAALELASAALAQQSILQGGPWVGKVTHPSGAPDNHLLTVYSPGPVNHQFEHLPQVDGGIYLIKSGKVVEEPETTSSSIAPLAGSFMYQVVDVGEVQFGAHCSKR